MWVCVLTEGRGSKWLAYVGQHILENDIYCIANTILHPVSDFRLFYCVPVLVCCCVRLYVHGIQAVSFFLSWLTFLAGVLYTIISCSRIFLKGENLAVLKICGQAFPP